MRKAFTLVELLIVVIIIVILATMAVPQYQKMVEKAKWTEAVSMLQAIRQASLLYYQETGFYPIKPTAQYFNRVEHINENPLDIDIPKAKNDRYVYFLFNEASFNVSGFLAAAFYDRNGDESPSTSEECIYVKLDGTLFSLGAPEFK